MTIETTEPITQGSDPEAAFAARADVAEALVALVAMFGHLPTPHITLPRSMPVITLQADSPAAFEAWRVALQIPQDDVRLKALDNRVWLAADGVFRGVPVELAGFGLSLSPEAVAA